MAAQAGLCLAWSETPEDTLCRVVAHMLSYQFHTHLFDVFLILKSVFVLSKKVVAETT